MKICLFIPSLVSGGAERVITHLANYWATSDKHEVYLLTLASLQEDSPFYFIDHRVKVIQLDLLSKDNTPFKKISRYLIQIVGVTKALQRLSPDVVIAFLDISIFLALVAKFFVKTKVIVSERNNPFLSVTNKVLKKLNLLLYRYADQLIIQTNQLAQEFPKHLQHMITVIPNPILMPTQQITDYKEAHNHKTVITIGRLHPQKGHDTLIKAFSKLTTLDSCFSWQLIFIGNGEEREYLENLARQCNVQSYITFAGRSTGIDRLLLKSSIFVLPSRYEGFPNALCEAMAIGLPSVATDCRFGPGEIIANLENGLLVPVEDEDALATALKKLMSDQELYKKLGHNAKKITETLAIEKIMKQWELVINDLVKQ